MAHKPKKDDKALATIGFHIKSHVECNIGIKHSDTYLTHLKIINLLGVFFLLLQRALRAH